MGVDSALHLEMCSLAYSVQVFHLFGSSHATHEDIKLWSLTLAYNLGLLHPLPVVELDAPILYTHALSYYIYEASWNLLRIEIINKV